MATLPFANYYNIDKRPHQILPDGTEEYVADADRWELFRLVQQAHDQRSDGQARSHTAAAPSERNPQRIIDCLFAARGEVGVILDLITSVEQQQALALTHVPYVPNLEEAEHKGALKIARRQASLTYISNRLRSGATSLRVDLAVDNTFMRTVAALRKHWRLKRHAAAQGGGFYVDLAILLPTGYEDALYGDDMDDATVNIHRDAASGDAYIVTTRPRPCKGLEAISEELRNMQRIVAWRTLRHCLELASRASAVDSEDDLTVAVVQSLVNAALASATNTESPLPRPAVLMETYMQHGIVQRGAFLHQIEAFTRAPGTQAAFETEALTALSSLEETARTPALIRQTRGSKVVGLLNRLTAWVRQGALKKNRMHGNT